MTSEGKEEEAFLLAAVRQAVARTSIRAVAKASGMSHGAIYNLATGSGITIQELLDRLLSLSKAHVRVEQDPERMRPSDVVRLIGDSSKFRADTGWAPEIPFDKTLSDLLEYWRERLKR